MRGTSSLALRTCADFSGIRLPLNSRLWILLIVSENHISRPKPQDSLSDPLYSLDCFRKIINIHTIASLARDYNKQCCRLCVDKDTALSLALSLSQFSPTSSDPWFSLPVRTVACCRKSLSEVFTLRRSWRGPFSPPGPFAYPRVVYVLLSLSTAKVLSNSCIIPNTGFPRLGYPPMVKTWEWSAVTVISVSSENPGNSRCD